MDKALFRNKLKGNILPLIIGGITILTFLYLAFLSVMVDILSAVPSLDLKYDMFYWGYTLYSLGALEIAFGVASIVFIVSLFINEEKIKKWLRVAIFAIIITILFSQMIPSIINLIDMCAYLHNSDRAMFVAQEILYILYLLFFATACLIFIIHALLGEKVKALKIIIAILGAVMGVLACVLLFVSQILELIPILEGIHYLRNELTIVLYVLGDLGYTFFVVMSCLTFVFTGVKFSKKKKAVEVDIKGEQLFIGEN